MADPFVLASQYANDQNRMAMQESNQAQNALMQMFEVEARRQAPYVQLPAELAAANIGGQAKLDRQIALADAKGKIGRRYGGKKKNADGTVSDELSEVSDGTGGEGETTTVVVGGKEYKVRAKPADKKPEVKE